MQWEAVFSWQSKRVKPAGLRLHVLRVMTHLDRCSLRLKQPRGVDGTGPRRLQTNRSQRELNGKFWETVTTEIVECWTDVVSTLLWVMMLQERDLVERIFRLHLRCSSVNIIYSHSQTTSTTSEPLLSKALNTAFSDDFTILWQWDQQPVVRQCPRTTVVQRWTILEK